MILLVILVVALAFVFIWRARSSAAYGPAVALCPGPDHYGYACEGATAYTYIDAAEPLGLYADDATMQLDLPFAFTFYGAEYTAVTVSTNGNLQFTTSSALAFPGCLTPAAGLGDLISPYWSDLDLRLYGELETATVGQAPERIFIIEWDAIPPFGGDEDDRVTFEVQLFEGANDVVFLYEDPATVEGGNGGAAVVGIQSERQGLALSFSCLQPVLPTGGGLRFVHPVEPNPNAAESEEQVVAPAAPAPSAKGSVAELAAGFAVDGPATLEQLTTHWRGARVPLVFSWSAVDMTGDGREELIALWNGGTANAGAAQVAALEANGNQLTPLFQSYLSTRDERYAAVSIAAAADLTGDGRADVVLWDKPTGRIWVLSSQSGEVSLIDVPERCQGSLVARDANGDGRPEIVRDGCDAPGRVIYGWNDQAFVLLP
jgi:hypothetical protein